ncbi:uncharacterized protein LOC131883712 isoform X7 [Tigriopus californicus]|uniref:uncharacterized protein LOC131883712 isoform X7 n=1 Tax=Tigriopus californicus TaxID=6832 RepID=UPI0027D9DD55|nr:uncharacterized protein LOC131883712 isoform X7 [Tigriopus californicus]
MGQPKNKRPGNQARDVTVILGGMKSTLSLSYKSWLALRNPQVLVLLAFAVLTIVSHSATAMTMDPLKRARVSSSSLIPFPRVGRSKRTGKSSLIPFPRVGRSGSNTWEVDTETLGDFERANEMHKMKENEESLALAYLYPALKSMVQRVLEDEDFTKRTY